MAPSKAELFDQLTKSAKIIDQIYKFGAVNSPNFLTMTDAVVQALEGDHAGSVANTLAKLQGQLSSNYAIGTELLNPILVNLARIGYSVNPAGMDMPTLLGKINDGMHAATETIQARRLSFGSVSAGGSNASNGNIYRTTKDANNYDLEGGLMGVVKFECVSDKNSGEQAGFEKLRVYGSGTQTRKDNIDIGNCTDEATTMSMHISGSDNNMLLNASFDQLQDTLASGGEQTGWTLKDATPAVSATPFNVVTATDLYRYTRGQETQSTPTGKAIKFVGNGSISQYIGRTRKAFRTDVPYFLIVRWMRKSSADGTLTFRLGSQTTTATVSSATNDVWNTTTIGPGTDDGWYVNFKEDWDNTLVTPNIGIGVRVMISLASWTTGSIVIDEIVLAPAIPFNGLFYLPIGGSLTGDALVGDTWAFTDAFVTSSAAEGRTQEVLSRLYKKSLPHTTGTPTYADA